MGGMALAGVCTRLLAAPRGNIQFVADFAEIFGFTGVLLLTLGKTLGFFEANSDPDASINSLNVTGHK